MSKHMEKITIRCANSSCPLPNGEFEVPFSIRKQRCCSTACSNIVRTRERAEKAKAHPAMTAATFDTLSKSITMIDVNRAAARRVLVDGELAVHVSASTGCPHNSIMVSVARYQKEERLIMEFDQFKDAAANYLEDAGIAYSQALDEELWGLYQRGVQPHDVPARIAAI